MAAHSTTTRFRAPVGKGEMLSVMKRRRPPKAPRLMGMASAFGVVDAIGAHDRDVATLHRGVTERVFGVVQDGRLVATPQPTVVVSEALSEFRRKLLRRVGVASRESRQSFCDTYTGRKRTIYLGAKVSLEHKPVQRSDAGGKIFVKAEKTNFTRKDDPAPRVIFPRDPRYNVEVGRRLKFVEHRVYSAIGSVFGCTTVCKGLNPEQRGRLLERNWQMFNSPVAVGLDASRFDQHVSHEMLSWEHGVYNAIFRDSELSRLLTWQLINRGKGFCHDGFLRFVKRGTRGSGDMNTAMGNCLIMCAMVWTFARERGVKIRLANDGDDCAVILDRSDLHAFMMGLQPWFLTLGFSMKVDYVTDMFEKIEFCQSHPVRVGSVVRMIRNPLKALSGDPCSLKLRDITTMQIHLGAVGICGGVLSPGVPVFQNFYRAMTREGNTKKARNILRRDVEMGNYGFTMSALMTDSTLTVRHERILPSTRVSFYRAFGVTPDVQCQLEKHYDSVRVGNRVHPIDKIGNLVNFSKQCSFLRWSLDGKTRR